jgi:hypothetical protein
LRCARPSLDRDDIFMTSRSIFFMSNVTHGDAQWISETLNFVFSLTLSDPLK